MKKFRLVGAFHFKVPFKFNLKMKLTTLLMLVSLFTMNANSYSQNARITLNLENVTVSELFAEIESLTDFRFLYNHDKVDVDRRVSVSAEKELISEILGSVFVDTNTHFKVRKKLIILKKGRESKIKTPEPEFVVRTPPAQSSIQGTVVDGGGVPLPGASIVEKGTANGVQTDFDGNFQLDVAGENAVLVISYIGYVTKEIAVGEQTTIDVVLQEDTALLDEVIVTAYGQETKKKLTSAVAQVDISNVEEVPFNSIADALAGQAAGLILQGSGGRPGSSPTISIRGGGEPLFVIDGVITDRSDFEAIPPSDIEELNLLKDAAATAVYGFSAANGVVVIKTKSGKGRLKVNLRQTFEASLPVSNPDRLNSVEFAEILNAAGVRVGEGAQFDAEALAQFADDNQQEFPNVDWYDISVGDYAPQKRTALSFSKGDDVIQTFFSLNYFNQKSIFTFTDAINNDRYTLRGNIGYSFDDIGLKVGLNLSANIYKNRFPAFSPSNIWSHIQNASPHVSAFLADGRYSGDNNGGHSVAETDPRSGYNRSNSALNRYQMTMNWKVPGVEGLTVDVLGAFERNWGNGKQFQTAAPQYDIATEEPISPFVNTNLNQSAFDGTEYVLQGFLSYERKKFGDGNTISAKIGVERQQAESQSFSAFRTGFDSNLVDQLFAGSTEGINNNGSANESSRLGYVGIFKYDYNERYVLSLTGRKDGSYLLPKGSRWGFFPSVSFAWNVSNEPFFSGLKEKKIINALKLRTSYGETGRLTNIDPFSYQNAYSLRPSAYVIGGQLVNGFNGGGFPSGQNITWFNQTAYNYGLDFDALNNTLSGSVDYFYYRTTGFLSSPLVDYTTPLGTGLPKVNSGTAQRRAGWEFSLVHKGGWGDFGYQIGANATLFDQLFEKNDDESEVDLKNPLVRTTHQTDFFERAYISDGFYDTDTEILNSPRRLGSGALRRGDLKYLDQNGDGKLDGNDQIRSGNAALPHLYYGFNFSFNYKGLRLGGLFQGTGKRTTKLGRIIGPGLAAFDARYQWQKDYWREDNQNAALPAYYTNRNANGNNNGVNSTFWHRDVGYLRLKSLTLSYDLKRNLMKKSKFISNAGLTISGTNLLTFSSKEVRDGLFDPETGNTSNYAYPVQKVYSLGLNIGIWGKKKEIIEE